MFLPRACLARCNSNPACETKLQMYKFSNLQSLKHCEVAILPAPPRKQLAATTHTRVQTMRKAHETFEECVDTCRPPLPKRQRGDGTQLSQKGSAVNSCAHLVFTWVPLRLQMRPISLGLRQTPLLDAYDSPVAPSCGHVPSGYAQDSIGVNFKRNFKLKYITRR